MLDCVHPVHHRRNGRGPRRRPSRHRHLNEHHVDHADDARDVFSAKQTTLALVLSIKVRK